VIDLLFSHTDSEGRPTAARFLAKKLWEWFAHPGPSLALVDACIPYEEKASFPRATGATPAYSDEIYKKWRWLLEGRSNE